MFAEKVHLRLASKLWNVCFQPRLLLLLLLLLRRAPRALEDGPSERQHLLEIGSDDSDWGRRATKGVLPEDIEVWASLQLVFKCLRPLLAQRARRVGYRIK